MALTKAQVREILSAAGVDSEHMKAAVDGIISGHAATVEVLKEEMEAYKSDAGKLADVQKELDGLKKLDNEGWRKKAEDWEKKYTDLHNANTEKETKAAKESAARAFYQSKNITGRALEIAMRGSTAEIAALELDGDKIKDTAALEALVKGDFSDLVRKTETRGADVAHPPANTGVGSLTKSDIYKKDGKGRYLMDAAERQNALAKMMSENQT